MTGRQDRTNVSVFSSRHPLSRAGLTRSGDRPERPISALRTFEPETRILPARLLMHGSLTQRLIAILCLLAFGLGQTLAVPLVRCTDESGTTRIEFACMKSAQGACLTPCIEPGLHAADDNHESDPVTPTPCEDEPLGSHASAAKLIPPSVSLELVCATVVVAILWDNWSFTTDQPASPRHPEVDRDRPPDSLARLRSVILIV